MIFKAFGYIFSGKAANIPAGCCVEKCRCLEPGCKHVQQSERSPGTIRLQAKNLKTMRSCARFWGRWRIVVLAEKRAELQGYLPIYKEKTRKYVTLFTIYTLTFVLYFDCV
jgi:hypothetical protein